MPSGIGRTQTQRSGLRSERKKEAADMQLSAFAGSGMEQASSDVPGGGVTLTGSVRAHVPHALFIPGARA